MFESELNKAMKKHRAKLLLESLIRSFLFGAAAAAAALFAVSLVFHLMGKEMSWALGVPLFAGVLIVFGAVVFVVKYLPTRKRVAERMDESGLEERVGTALDYKDVQTEAAQAQREDTMRTLKGAKVKTRMHVGLREALICLVALLLTASMLLLPHDLFSVVSRSEPDPEQQRQERITEELIKKLREKIEENKEVNGEELEKELKEMVDSLEKDLKKSEGALEKAAQMKKAADRNDEAFDKELKKNDPSKEQSAEEKERAESLEKEQKEIDELLEKAKEMMLDGSEPQEGEEEPGEGEEGEEGEPQPGEEGQPGEGEQGQEGEGEEKGPGKPDGMGDPINGSTQKDRSEPIYDSVSGKVEYGEVFDTYFKDYAEYAKAILDGGLDVSPEIVKLMEEYFAALS